MISVHNLSRTRPTQGFWDEQTIRFLARYGRLVVINGVTEGTGPLYVSLGRDGYHFRDIGRAFARAGTVFPARLLKISLDE